MTNKMVMNIGRQGEISAGGHDLSSRELVGYLQPTAQIACADLFATLLAVKETKVKRISLWGRNSSN